MDEAPLTCERVDRDDLDTRYLAGTLSEPEALAFEAHYFGCDRCWHLVQRGAEIRAAGRPNAASGGAPAAAPRPGPRATRWRWTVWVPVAAAAAALLWLVTDQGPVSPGAPDSTVRGTPVTEALTVRPVSGEGNLGISWSPVTGAALYQVRLFGESGELRWERRITDTMVTVMVDSLGGDRKGSLYWQLQALDNTGAPVARSPLVEAPPRRSPR